MRSAGNFHPEWGYLAPAPSFMRSVRTALVATAIGAIAGAVVVVSLVGHPGANDKDTSIAAHALVTTTAPVVAAPAVAALPFGKAAAAMLAQAPAPPKLQPAQQASAVSAASAAPSAPRTEIKTAVKPAAPTSAGEVAAAPAASQSPTPVAGPLAALPDDATPADAGPAVATDAPVANTAASRRHRIESYQARRRWQAANSGKKHWHDDRGFAALFRIFGGPFAN